VRAVADTELVSELSRFSDAADNGHFSDPKNSMANVASFKGVFDGHEVTSPLDVYAPPSLFPFSPLTSGAVRETLDEELSDAPPAKTRSSILVYFVKDIFFNGQYSEKNAVEKSARIVFPSASYIESYLEMVRVNLVNFSETDDLEKKKQYLANAYQPGIRSQAFETVWNSEMMGIVNFFLINKLKMNPVAHGSVDFYAFFLSKEAFARYFVSFIDAFNGT
jgi:hypothetical protein